MTLSGSLISTKLPKACRTSSKRLLGKLQLQGCGLKFEFPTIHGVKATMAEYLRMMRAMIQDLKVAENELKDEQQVLAVIHLLPDSDWSQMKLLMTYGENIKTFSDISCYLELVAKCMEASSSVALVARSHKHRRFKPKREKYGDNVEQKNKNQTPQDEIWKRRKDKCVNSRDVSKLKCYNYKNKGYFAQDCPKQRQVTLPLFSTYFVCSYALVAHSFPNWIVNTGANKHIICEGGSFVDYHTSPIEDTEGRKMSATIQ